MASFNQVTLMGNCTRDPQVKFTGDQKAICEFGLAINRKYKLANGEEREEVCFVDCTAFGKTGEVIAQYVAKGKPLLVSGRLKYDSWEDKNGGGKRSKLSVVVDNFQFIGPKDGGGEDRPAPAPAARGSEYPRSRQATAARPAPPPPFDEEPAFREADIPF